MRLILFIIMVVFGWVSSKLPLDVTRLLVSPLLLFVVTRLMSEKFKKISTWWLLAIFWPASLLAVDLLFYLPPRLIKGIPYSREQFNETLIWSVVLGLIQYGVFYVLHWVWVFVKKSLSQKQTS